MPGRKTKMSTAREEELRWKVLDILVHSDNALTTSDIIAQDPFLHGITPQKITRVLSYLNEMGFVRKAKSKSLNRMVYKAVSKMQEQGYDVEDPICMPKPYYGIDWELEEEINNRNIEDETEEV